MHSSICVDWVVVVVVVVVVVADNDGDGDDDDVVVFGRPGPVVDD